MNIPSTPTGDSGSTNKTQETMQTQGVTPTTSNVPQTPDVVTLSTLLSLVSSATNTENKGPSVNEDNTPSGGKEDDTGDVKDTDEKTSSSPILHKKRIQTREENQGGTKGGEDIKKLHDREVTARSFVSIQPQSLSGEANVDSTIDRQMPRETSKESLNTTRSLTDHFSPTNLSSTAKTLSLAMPTYCSSIGLSSSTTNAAMTHFQAASNLADRLDNLSDEAPQAVSNSLSQAIFTETFNGFKALSQEVFTNTQALTSVLSQNYPKAFSSVLAEKIVNMVTNQQTTTTSSSSTPENSSPSLTAMINAIALFQTNVMNTQVNMAQFQELMNTATADISYDNAQASNVITANTISEVHKTENQEAQEAKKQKSSDTLMGALSIIGGALGCIAAVVIFATTEWTGVGAAAAIVLFAVSADAIAQGAGETEGKSMNTSEIIGKGLSEIFGGNQKDWTIAVEVLGTVAATAAGFATGGPLGALMMFSMMATQSGLSDTATAGIASSLGANQNQIQQAEMGVNIGLAGISILAGGYEGISSMTKGASSAAKEASVAADAAKVTGSTARTTADAATNLARTSKSADAVSKAADSVTVANQAQEAAQKSIEAAEVANKAANDATAFKAAGNTTGFKQATILAKQSAAEAQEYATQAQNLSKKASSLLTSAQKISNQEDTITEIGSTTRDTIDADSLSDDETDTFNVNSTKGEEGRPAMTNNDSDEDSDYDVDSDTEESGRGTITSADLTPDEVEMLQGSSGMNTAAAITTTSKAGEDVSNSTISNMSKAVSDTIDSVSSTFKVMSEKMSSFVKTMKNSIEESSIAKSAENLQESIQANKNLILKSCMIVTGLGEIAETAGGIAQFAIQLQLATIMIQMSKELASIETDKAMTELFDSIAKSTNSWGPSAINQENTLIGNLGQGASIVANSAPTISQIWDN